MQRKSRKNKASSRRAEAQSATEHRNTDTNTCSECDSKLIEDEAGETVCEGCGLVHDETVIDRGPEWRAFDNNRDEKSRVGSPVTNLMHDKGLSTKIGDDKTDAYGNGFSQRKRKQLSRLRTWDNRDTTSKERGLKEALNEIRRIGSALGLTKNVRETASMIFRQAHERKLVRGRSIETIAAASVYAASRQCGTPRSLDEMYPVSKAHENFDQDEIEKKINRAARYLINELELNVGVPDPRKFLNRFLSNMEFDDGVDTTTVNNTARDIINISEERNNHSGKSPTSIASGAIYAACLVEGVDITQAHIAEVADVTEVTIRNRYNEMLDAYTSEVDGL